MLSLSPVIVIADGVIIVIFVFDTTIIADFSRELLLSTYLILPVPLFKGVSPLNIPGIHSPASRGALITRTTRLRRNGVFLAKPQRVRQVLLRDLGLLTPARRPQSDDPGQDHHSSQTRGCSRSSWATSTVRSRVVTSPVQPLDPSPPLTLRSRLHARARPLNKRVQ